MNPFDFYSLAKSLNENLGNKNDPLYQATLRSCISRAYYSSYLSARDVSELKPQGKKTHADVIYYYSSDTRLHNYLKDLKALRQKADYDIVASVQFREVEKALFYCEKIFGFLEKYQKIS